jgi:hypothetical protein
VRALTLLTVIGAAVVLGWLLVSIREVIAGLFAGLGRRDSEVPSVTMWQKDADGKVRREIVDLDSERLSDDERAMVEMMKGIKECPQCGGFAKRSETRHSCGYEFPAP